MNLHASRAPRPSWVVSGSTGPRGFYRSSTEPLTNSRYRPPQDETPIAREPYETTPFGTWRHQPTRLRAN